MLLLSGMRRVVFRVVGGEGIRKGEIEGGKKIYEVNTFRRNGLF